jgi:hypothetical protein
MEHTDAPEHVLCENCGYAVGGIDTSLACPECGSPVAGSLPERRRGSPWQRSGLAGERRAAAAWSATLIAFVRRPSTFWRDVRITRRRAVQLLMLNCTIAAAGATLVLAGEWNGRATPTSYIAAFFVVSMLMLLALSSVEYTGVRFFGRRRGWRITRVSALVIIAHASFAWLIAGFGMALAGHVARRLPFLWDGRLTLGLPDIAWFAIIAGAPVILGMVLFSTLSGLGFHALRYANAPAEPTRTEPLPD